MHFFKTHDRFPIRIISEIIELILNVWNVFIASLILAYWGAMIQQELVYEISLNFPELFIIEKYVKISFKNQG